MKRATMNIVVVEDQADCLEAIKSALEEQTLLPVVVHTINPCERGRDSRMTLDEVCHKIRMALSDKGNRGVLLLDHSFGPDGYTGEDVSKHFLGTPIVSISGGKKRTYANENFNLKMYLLHPQGVDEKKEWLISAVAHADRMFTRN